MEKDDKRYVIVTCIVFGCVIFWAIALFLKPTKVDFREDVVEAVVGQLDCYDDLFDELVKVDNEILAKRDGKYLHSLFERPNIPIKFRAIPMRIVKDHLSHDFNEKCLRTNAINSSDLGIRYINSKNIVFEVFATDKPTSYGHHVFEFHRIIYSSSELNTDYWFLPREKVVKEFELENGSVYQVSQYYFK